MSDEKALVRVAAVADVHCYEEIRGQLRREFHSVNEQADVLVLAGDLTLYGSVDEAEILAEELRAVEIPVVAVLGNHDFERQEECQITSRLQDVGVHVLDGSGVHVRCGDVSVGFAGTKGFCGGFGNRLVAPFGEQQLKEFVRSGEEEAAKLESSLRSLDAHYRVVVVHYAPIRETVTGEPEELFPFLGNSSLCVPIDTYGADVVFHGHAHYGSPFGRTSTGIPVYNVARPLIGHFATYVLGAGDRELQNV